MVNFFGLVITNIRKACKHKNLQPFRGSTFRGLPAHQRRPGFRVDVKPEPMNGIKKNYHHAVFFGPILDYWGYMKVKPD
jgi:hypothetical protein